MKLIHKSTGLEVREGDTVRDFRGEAGIVIGWTKPRSPASTGRITVRSKFSDNEHHCYPDVYSCEWIDREDRIEDSQPTPVGGFVPSLPSVSSSDQTAQLMAEVKENFKKIQETLNEIKALLL